MTRAAAAIQIGPSTWATIVYAEDGRVLELVTFDAPTRPAQWTSAADRALEERGHRRTTPWAAQPPFGDPGYPDVHCVARAAVVPCMPAIRALRSPSRPASSRVER